jgi:hypothetical protein
VTESADTVIARTSSRRPLWQRLIRYVLLVAIFAIPAAVLLSYEGFCFDRARFVGEMLPSRTSCEAIRIAAPWIDIPGDEACSTW